MRQPRFASSVLVVVVTVIAGACPGPATENTGEGEGEGAGDGFVAELSGAFTEEHELPAFVDGFYYRGPLVNGVSTDIVAGVIAVTFPNACEVMSTFEAGIIDIQADFQVDHDTQVLEDRTNALEADLFPPLSWQLQVLPSPTEQGSANVNACQSDTTNSGGDACFSAFRKPVDIVDEGQNARVDVDGADIELLDISLHKAALTFHLELPRCVTYEAALGSAGAAGT